MIKDLRLKTGLEHNSSQCSHNKTATGAATVATRWLCILQPAACFHLNVVTTQLQVHISYTWTKHTPVFYVTNSKHILKQHVYTYMFSLNCRSAGERSSSLRMIVIGWLQRVLHYDWSNRVPIMRALKPLRMFGWDDTTLPVCSVL